MEKEIQISYQDLAKISGRSIPQLRRCALMFHGVSPEADRQSGVAREFSLTDGFAVYLMGILVDDCALKLEEASKHVWRILWNVGRVGPEADLTELGYLRPIVAWKQGFPVAGVMLRIYPGPRPAYDFRVFQKVPVVVDDWGKGTQERVDTYTSFWLPKTAMGKEGAGGTPGKVYEISLSAHLKLFLESLRGLGF